MDEFETGFQDEDTQTVLYQIPPAYEIIEAPDELIFYSGDDYVTFTGDSLDILLQSISPLQQGVTIDELSSAINVDDSAAKELLALLEDKGVVEAIETTTVESAAWSDPVQFHYRYRSDAAYAANAPKEFDCPPLLICPEVENKNSEVIENLGLAVRRTTHEEVDGLGNADAVVSITYGHSPQVNLEYEQWVREKNIPLLPVRLFFQRILIGPFHIPGETVSFRAAYQREKTGCVEPSGEIRIENNLHNKPAFPLLQEHDSIIKAYITAELRSYLSGTNSQATADAVIEFDLETLQTSRTHVLRLPQRSPKGEH